MMRHKCLEHRFVQHIPRHLEPGVLYVSIEYATAAHTCCCGCGEGLRNMPTAKGTSKHPIMRAPHPQYPGEQK